MFKASEWRLLEVMRDKHYVCVGPELPYYLNIIGIRAHNLKANGFSDTLVTLFFDDKEKPVIDYFPAITNPARYYLRHSKTNIPLYGIREGNYFNAFSIGELGKQDALAQTRQLPFRRINRGKTDKVCCKNGIYMLEADKNSLQEIKENPNKGDHFIGTGFNRLMQYCELHRKYHGNFFNYTLLRDKDF